MGMSPRGEIASPGIRVQSKGRELSIGNQVLSLTGPFEDVQFRLIRPSFGLIANNYFSKRMAANHRATGFYSIANWGRVLKTLLQDQQGT